MKIKALFVWWMWNVTNQLKWPNKRWPNNAKLKKDIEDAMAKYRPFGFLARRLGVSVRHLMTSVKGCIFFHILCRSLVLLSGLRLSGFGIKNKKYNLNKIDESPFSFIIVSLMGRHFESRKALSWSPSRLRPSLPAPIFKTQTKTTPTDPNQNNCL